jgi:outer membrane protein assembly factor BamD (BamD/ComL family)
MIAQQQAAQGVQQLDEIINRFSRTTAAAEARLVKSEYLLSQKNYAEAESLLLPVIARGKPATLRPLALVALAAVQEEAGNFPAAVATCQQFLQKYPGHFLTPKMYESIARINLVSGSLADAQAAAEKLTTLYPATPWAERAQQLLRLAPQQSATTAPAVAPLSSSR